MQLEQGMRASLSKTITAEDVAEFARLTMDTNPLHLDEAYAAKTRFGGRIAHGMLAAGLVSAVLGTQLGGPIYLGQTLKFVKPVRIGDTLTASAEVIAVRGGKNIVTLKTTVVNQEGAEVLVGEATVLPV